MNDVAPEDYAYFLESSPQWSSAVGDLFWAFYEPGVPTGITAQGCIDLLRQDKPVEVRCFKRITLEDSEVQGEPTTLQNFEALKLFCEQYLSAESKVIRDPSMKAEAPLDADGSGRAPAVSNMPWHPSQMNKK